MSNFYFFNNNNKTKNYNDPYSILRGDITSVRNRVAAAIDLLEKDANLINPEVILPFLSGANTCLHTLLNESLKGKKFGEEIKDYKSQYEQLIKDLISGLDKAQFGNADKLGKRCLDGLKTHLEWHDKLSAALIQHTGRPHRINR